MLPLLQRTIDSPLVQHIALMRFSEPGRTLIVPDGSWDMVFMTQHGVTNVLRTGLTTKPVELAYEKDDEILYITFKPDIFMPLMPGVSMRDEGVLLPKFGSSHFSIGPDTFEIPTFETADLFVDQMQRKGLLEANDVVSSLISGKPKAMSDRTMQRHFLRTTGLTYKYFNQIQRAQKAVGLLQLGRSGTEVAFALGYTDQPHMIKTLKYIMGRTPREIKQDTLS